MDLLYQQIEEQDQQIDKATRVIEALTAQIEQNQKDLLKLKFENEFLNQQNKGLEKDNLSLQKESNNIETIKKFETRQKQINQSQKDKIERYAKLLEESEQRYTSTISELNENINQLVFDNQEKDKEIEMLHKQGQQQQLAINQVMQVLEQKESELLQLNEYFAKQKESQEYYNLNFKQNIEDLKKFTENLFIQSDKNLIMQVNKGKILKNGTFQEYKEEQIDESHIYDIILRQRKHINQIFQKLQDKLSNEQLSEHIVQVNQMKKYFEIMQEKIQEINIERNIIFQAYQQLMVQSKTQQSFIEQLSAMVKNLLQNDNVELIASIEGADLQIFEPLNQTMQMLFQTYTQNLSIKDHQCEQLQEQNQKFAQQIEYFQSQKQQQQLQQQLQQQSQQQQQQQQQNSQQLVNLLQTKKQKQSSTKVEKLEKENQQLIEQLNDLSKQHEETVLMLEKAITQLESQVNTETTTQLVESQIDRFLESCSLLVPLKSQTQESVIQKTNILIDLVTMLTDSQHDMLQKLLVTFLVTRDNRSLAGFEKDFQELKSNRHNVGILDYLDKLECLKNQLLGIVEKELKCEYAIPYGKSILIQALNSIAQRYMEIVQQDSTLIETQMKKYKNHITIYKMYKIWKECVLDFSEILFEIIESIDRVGQPQFESRLMKLKLNYRFIDCFNE